MRLFFAFFSVFFLLAGLAFGKASKTGEFPPTLDLEEFGDLNNRTFILKNNWGFAWNKFVEDHFEISENEVHIVDLGNNWKHYKPTNYGSNSEGFATYFISIVTDTSFKNVGIKIPPLKGAAKLQVNGKTYTSVGKVGKEKKSTIPEFDSKIIRLEPSENGIYHIFIQVANFHYRRGGLISAPEFGSFDELTKKKKNNSYLILVLFGVFISLAFYLVSFYFYLKRPPFLYFGLFCMALAARLLIIKDVVINEFFTLPWHWILRIDFLTFYLGSLFFILLARSVFKKIVNRQVFHAIVTIVFLFNLTVIFSEPPVFNFMAIPFQLTIVCITMYFLFRIGKFALEGDSTARIFFTGIIIFYLAILNDILFINGIISTGEIFYTGLLFLMVSALLMLPFYFSKVYKKVNLLTNELSAQNEELKSVNSELDRLIYIVSHDLKSPLSSLQGLINIARRENVAEPIHDILNLQEKSVKNLKHFIDDILNYTKNTKGEFNSKPVNFNFLVNELVDGIAYQQGYENISVFLNIVQRENFNTDLFRLKIILNNLISNAYKFHDPKKLHPKVSVVIKVSNGKALIEIEDNGIGIPEKQLKNVFNMFYRGSNTSVEGTGLGLYLVNECVVALKGKISVDSEENVGTTILIEIPDYHAFGKHEESVGIDEAKEGKFILKMRRLLRLNNMSEMTV